MVPYHGSGVADMSIDTILLPIPGSEPNPVIMETGVRAAKATGAHVVGMFIDNPQQMGGRQALPLYSVSTLQAQSYEMAAEQAADEGSKVEEQLRARFEEMCAEHGVAFAGGDIGTGSGPTAEWGYQRRDLMDVLDEQVPAFDMVVAASASVSGIEREIADHVLRHCERPVLLSASKAGRDIDDKVAVAWQASPECWHAISAAMPLMQHAQSVTVLSVCNGKDRDEVSASQEEIVEYLERHGAKATGRVAERNVRKVPDAIMTEANEAGAGLIVMGAYSHSPWREMIFGGVTRTVLSRVASTPVLMAH